MYPAFCKRFSQIYIFISRFFPELHREHKHPLYRYYQMRSLNQKYTNSILFEKPVGTNTQGDT